MLIAASDLCLIPYARTPLDNCNPCKLAEYLACGRPVLAADVSDMPSYAGVGVTLYAVWNATQLATKTRALLTKRLQQLRWSV